MRLAIIDDLVTEQEKLQGFLDRFCKEKQVECHVEKFSSGKEFLTRGDFAYDLLFLDIFMEELDGLETAAAFRQHNEKCLLIFTTTSKDCAIKSYRVRAFDYLVKPFTYQQFLESMLLVVKELNVLHQFIEVKEGYLIRKIACKDIIYVDYSNHYTHIHTTDAIISSHIPFEKIRERLVPYKQFLYCNRNCLLNMDQIQDVENNEFVMNNGERLATKRNEYNSLYQSYADYLFAKLQNRSCP